MLASPTGANPISTTVAATVRAKAKPTLCCKADSGNGSRVRTNRRVAMTYKAAARVPNATSVSPSSEP